MAQAVAQPQSAALLVVKEDTDEVARDDLADDVRDGLHQRFEIEGLRDTRRHLEQEVHQIGTLAEVERGLVEGRHE